MLFYGQVFLPNHNTINYMIKNQYNHPINGMTATLFSWIHVKEYKINKLTEINDKINATTSLELMKLQEINTLLKKIISEQKHYISILYYILSLITIVPFELPDFNLDLSLSEMPDLNIPDAPVFLPISLDAPSLPDFEPPNFSTIDFSISDSSLPELPVFQPFSLLPEMELPALELPALELPEMELPALEMPSFPLDSDINFTFLGFIIPQPILDQMKFFIELNAFNIFFLEDLHFHISQLIELNEEENNKLTLEQNKTEEEINNLLTIV